MGMSVYGDMKLFALFRPGKNASKPLNIATIVQKHTAKYARKGCRGDLQGRLERGMALCLRP